MWIPENDVWVDILADQGVASFAQDCRSTAESPLVIGMWRPVAESLGWPGLPLGWLDIGSLAADPSAWAYYSGGEFGDSLRMSHAHPGLSGAGTGTLLAIVQAAQSKTDAVTPDDIAQPIVQASVGAFESAVSSFNTNTENLGKTMVERGPGYLGAGVMYESTIVQHGDGRVGGHLSPGRHFYGHATRPASTRLPAAKRSKRPAIFRDYLLERSGAGTGSGGRFAARQSGRAHWLAHWTRHMALIRRSPKSYSIRQTADAVYAVQDLWQSARKPVNLVMLLDTSGSMRGSKIESMQVGGRRICAEYGRRRHDQPD